MSDETVVSVEMVDAGVDRAESFGWEHFGEDDAREIYLAMHAARPSQPPVTDVEDLFMNAIEEEARNGNGREGLVYSYGQVERGVRAAIATIQSGE